MLSPFLICRFCPWKTPNRANRRLKPAQQEAFARLSQHVYDEHPYEPSIMNDQDLAEFEMDEIIDELHTHRSTTEEPELALLDDSYCDL